MANISESMIGSTVVKTIRNIKSQRHPDLAYNTLQQNESEDNSGKSTAPEENSSIVKRSGTQPNSIKTFQKIRTVVLDRGNSGEEEPEEEDDGGNVFKRLAKPKGKTYKDDRKKKALVKEYKINYFDLQHRQAILGIGLVDTVLSKSKEVKELMENFSVSRGYINKYIIEDSHFILCFIGLLDRMYKNSEIEADLKNLNKQIFTKFETFVATKIHSRIKLDNINQAIQEHTKSADVMISKRINQLKRLL